jgi:MoxR-like ATPase
MQTTTEHLALSHKVISAEDAKKFLLPGYEMDQYFPKQGAHCGAEHLQYYFQVIWPLISAYRKVIVAQKAMTTFATLGLFAVGDRDLSGRHPGHVYLIANPGTGKTLLANVPSRVFDMKSSRIQGTADLLPSDYIGGYIREANRETGQMEFTFIPGPAFADFQLADEISRVSPRTQSAFLQVLCEGVITVGNETYPANPFMIMTGNEIESEGTHKPADALMDRVMFQVRATPFTIEDRIEIMRRTDKFDQIKIDQVASYEKIKEVREFFHHHVHISDEVTEFTARLSDTLNKPDEFGLFDGLRKRFGFAAGEEILNSRAAILEGRGMLHLRGASRAMAGVLRFRPYVTLEDVEKVVLPVIRHRTHFMPGALEDFRDQMRPELARMFGGKAGRVEMHEYLLRGLIKSAWNSVALSMQKTRSIHVGR